MKKLIVLLLASISLSAFAIENLGNYNEWKRLHDVYINALKEVNPEYSGQKREMNQDDFGLLQKDVSLREKYLDFMSDIEEQCASKPELKGCRELLNNTQDKDINTCLGNFDYTFTNESIDDLQEKVEMIYLAATPAAQLKEQYKSYSESTQVANMIARLRRNLTKLCTSAGCKTNRKAGSTGKCLRYVKWGWIGGGFTKTYPGTRHARDSGGNLKRMGFKNLMEQAGGKTLTARDAPIGSVLVYERGPSGHVEVKAGQNEYLSDFKAASPINEYLNRKLIGIYVK